jgi:DNA-binding transcriptional regulator GbsR (MarR family)
VNAAAIPSPGSGDADWQLEFIDRVGAWADVSGLPPSYVRVFAWLVVCDPPEQSVEELRARLGLSAGAISMATAALGRMGIVERVARSGERRAYYRFHPRGWEQVLRLRLEATAQTRAAAKEALSRASDRHLRLEGMHDMYAHFERSIAEYLGARSGQPGH